MSDRIMATVKQVQLLAHIEESLGVRYTGTRWEKKAVESFLHEHAVNQNQSEVHADGISDSPATEKQINFMRKLEENNPKFEGELTKANVSAYIDKCLKSGNANPRNSGSHSNAKISDPDSPATEKQISFMRKLEENNTRFEGELTKANVSAYIDKCLKSGNANRGSSVSSSQGDAPASDKQIKFATNIAKVLDIQIPSSQSKKSISEFINTHIEQFNQTRMQGNQDESSPTYPTDKQRQRIKKIQAATGIQFTGSSFSDAKQYIAKYQSDASKFGG